MYENKIHGTYLLHVGNYDWGAAADYIIITTDQPVSDISLELWKVKERKMEGDQTKSDYPLVEVENSRTVTAVSYCNEDGTIADGPTCNIKMDLYVSPTEGSPFACTSKTQIFIWSKPYELDIDYSGQANVQINPEYASKVTAADMFAKKSYETSSGIRYDYAEYVPEKQTDTLFVWLHGLGEGRLEGSDVYLPLLGRKGTTMAGEKFQSMIGGAVVIAPQCPTYWMDGDGKQTNFNNGSIKADGTSHYTSSLEEFIDAYAEGMKAKRIVLAGCSNGGYMCMMLAMSRPDHYCAVVPICEAVPDKSISEESIQKLKDVPLYFVYSNDDPIVPPALHEIPTIERLKAAGAADLHSSVTEHVIDTSGTYKNEDGSPYEYLGHLSWIYYDNNETSDDNGISAWEWLSLKIQKNE